MAVKTVLKDVREFNEILARRGFNIKTFSEVSTVGYHTIQQMLQGRRNPSPPIAIKVCKALGMEFDDLFKFDHRRGKTYVGGPGTRKKVQRERKPEAAVN